MLELLGFLWICYFSHTLLAASRAKAGTTCSAQPQRLLQAQACGSQGAYGTEAQHQWAQLWSPLRGEATAFRKRCQATASKSCLARLQLQDLASSLLQARIEEVGQGLLRRTQEASGLGIRRKGQRSRFHMDAYEEHMLLPEVGLASFQ